jgi:glycosyltransferase involved in cell wall biosynthesis
VPSQVIYNGIDLQKFDNNSRLDLPTALAHNFQGKVIGIVARLHPIKGLDVLLDAFTIISEEFDNVQLWIVGDGPDQEKLKHRAAQLGIISKVIFWGKCDNIPSILKFVDVGVMSSHVEGLPNAIIEYMSARLPVVSTNVGGIPELVVHNNTGLLVDPADPTKLAQAVLVLLKSPGLSRSLGENGRKLIEKSFDLGRMVIETETIYETLCPRK